MHEAVAPGRNQQAGEYQGDAGQGGQDDSGDPDQDEQHRNQVKDE